MHDRQYRDYKSGTAKNRFEDELQRAKDASMVKNGYSEEEIRKCLEQAIRGKPKMHHFEEQNFITEQKNMSQIGG